MTDETHRPVILISAAAPNTDSVVAIMAKIRAAGAEPMLISHHLDRIAGKDDDDVIAQVRSDLAKADGVIVMGNNHDINPADYAAADIHPRTKVETVTPEGAARAKYEYALIGTVLREKVPYLGVCGGMQRLNVMLGGTLNQHVPDLIGTDEHDQSIKHIPGYVPVEYIQIAEGTALAGIASGVPGLFTPASRDLPKGRIAENSFHHQAVDKVGNGLRSAAVSFEPDTPQIHVIEAIEADPNGPFKDQFLMGVQWHPEFIASPVSARLLDRFTDVAREYGKGRATSDEVMQETVRSLGEQALTDINADGSESLVGRWASRVARQPASTGVSR